MPGASAFAARQAGSITRPAVASKGTGSDAFGRSRPASARASGHRSAPRIRASVGLERRGIVRNAVAGQHVGRIVVLAAAIADASGLAMGSVPRRRRVHGRAVSDCPQRWPIPVAPACRAAGRMRDADTLPAAPQGRRDAEGASRRGRGRRSRCLSATSGPVPPGRASCRDDSGCRGAGPTSPARRALSSDRVRSALEGRLAAAKGPESAPAGPTPAPMDNRRGTGASTRGTFLGTARRPRGGGPPGRLRGAWP